MSLYNLHDCGYVYSLNIFTTASDFLVLFLIASERAFVVRRGAAYLIPLRIAIQ